VPVLEADDIDELLSSTQAEPEDELRATEPSMEDSLSSIFKWPDFDPKSMTMRSLKKK
jgi:hypothetical protein